MDLIPTAPYDALGVRQRLLAESALHALSPQRRQPLVVSLPAGWDPGSDWASSRFFAGLDQPWLQLVDLPSVLSAARTPARRQRSPAGLPDRAAGGRGAGVQPRHHPGAGPGRRRLRAAAERERHRRRPARPDRDARLVARCPPQRRPGAGPHREQHRLRALPDGPGADRGAAVRDDVRRVRADPGDPGQRPRPARHRRAAQRHPRLEPEDREVRPGHPRPRPAYVDPARGQLSRHRGARGDPADHRRRRGAAGQRDPVQRPHESRQHGDLGDHGGGRRPAAGRDRGPAVPPDPPPPVHPRAVAAPAPVRPGAPA